MNVTIKTGQSELEALKGFYRAKESQTQRLLKYIPKKFHEGIEEAYHDNDGYWIYLKEGWINMLMESHIIHTDTINELRKEAKFISREDQV